MAKVSIVLVEPKYPENIGAAARVAMNMGIPEVIVVRGEEPDREKMLKMATHKAAHIIEQMQSFDELAPALEGFSYVVGTTARQGRLRHVPDNPAKMAVKVAPRLKNNRAALLFGPEDRGLTNEDLKYCNLTSTIPTHAFSSLNLAQAVGIHCYELFTKVLELDTNKEIFSPKLADTRELEGMYAHVEQVLRRIDFIKLREVENGHWMQSVRKFMGRLDLRAKEVKMIRGFCRKMLWYEEKRLD